MKLRRPVGARLWEFEHILTLFNRSDTLQSEIPKSHLFGGHSYPSGTTWLRSGFSDAFWNKLKDPWAGHWVHDPKFPLYQQEGEAHRGAVISPQAYSSAKCLS